jgi:thioredoxin-dependent peroxiredoxin
MLCDRPAALLGLLTLLAAALWMASAAWAGGDGVKEGDPAPEVKLPAALPEGKTATVDLKDYKGKKHVVLYFFPKALTGGWTAEACAFRDRLEQFAQLDTQVIGISTDTVILQDKFIKKEMLTFPLLADPDGKVTTKFGVLSPKKFAKRATFIINKEGTVARVFPAVGNAGAHPEEVLEFVKKNLAKK